MGCKHCSRECKYEKREFKDSRGVVYAVTDEFVGYTRVCAAGHDDTLHEWHKRNANSPYEEWKKDTLDCFEPYETTLALHEANELAKEILEDIKKKKNEQEV